MDGGKTRRIVQFSRVWRWGLIKQKDLRLYWVFRESSSYLLPPKRFRNKHSPLYGLFLFVSTLCLSLPPVGTDSMTEFSLSYSLVFFVFSYVLSLVFFRSLSADCAPGQCNNWWGSTLQILNVGTYKLPLFSEQTQTQELKQTIRRSFISIRSFRLFQKTN